MESIDANENNPHINGELPKSSVDNGLMESDNSREVDNCFDHYNDGLSGSSESNLIEDKALKQLPKMSKYYSVNDALFLDREVPSEHDSDELVQYEVHQVQEEGFWNYDGDTSTELDISIMIVPNGIIINSNIFLTELQWNTITCIDENLYNCAVCEIFGDKLHMEEHVKSDCHRVSMGRWKPLRQYDLSIVRKIKDQLHCGICNVKFHYTEFREHESTKDHEGNLLASINRVSDLTFDANMQTKKYETLNMQGQRNLFGDLGCNQANEAASNRRPDQSCRPDQSGRPDQICPDQSGRPDQSCPDQSGQQDQRPKSHWNLSSVQKTKNNNDMCRLNANPIRNVRVYDDFSDDEECYEYTTPHEGVSYASMARKPRVELPKNLKIDLGTKEVRVKFESWHMLITPERNKFYCMVCNEVDMIRNKASHVSSEGHTRRLNACSVLASFDNYFIRMVNDKLYHCGHCNNLQYNHQMESHIESVHPRKTKIIIDTTSKTSPIHKSENDKVRSDKADANLGDVTIAPFGCTLKISLLSYNMIFKKGDGYCCYVCDVICDNVRVHVGESVHCHLINMTPFIRLFKSHLTRAVKGSLHCAICNKLITVNDIYIHNVEPLHTNALAEALGIRQSENSANTNNIVTVDVKHIDTYNSDTLSVKKNVGNDAPKNANTINSLVYISSDSASNLTAVDSKEYPKLPKAKRVETKESVKNKASENDNFTAALKSALKVQSSNHGEKSPLNAVSPRDSGSESRSSTPSRVETATRTPDLAANFKMPVNKNEPLKKTAGKSQNKQASLWGSNLPPKLSHAEYLMHRSQNSPQIGQNSTSNQSSLYPSPNSLFPNNNGHFPNPSQLPNVNAFLPTPNSLFPAPNSLFPVPNSLMPAPNSLMPTPNSLLRNPNSHLTTPKPLMSIPTSFPSGSNGLFPTPNPFFPQNTLPGQNAFPGQNYPNIQNFQQNHGARIPPYSGQFNPGHNYSNFGQNFNHFQGNPMNFNTPTPGGNFNVFPQQAYVQPNFNSPNSKYSNTPMHMPEKKQQNHKNQSCQEVLKIGKTEEGSTQIVEELRATELGMPVKNECKVTTLLEGKCAIKAYFKDFGTMKDMFCPNTNEHCSDEEDAKFNDEEIVILTTKASYFKVSNISYHTLVYVDNGIRQCFVCSMTVKMGKFQHHIESREHMRNLKKTRFLEKHRGQLFRQMYLLYHCAVCNVVMTGREIKMHIDWPLHIESYQNSHYKINRRTRKELKSGAKVYAVETQKEAIYNNVNDPEIKIVYSYLIVPDSTPVKETKCVQKPIKIAAKKRNQLIIYQNTVLKISFDNWHGIYTYKNATKCLLCQVDLKPEHVMAHVGMDCHAALLGVPFESRYYPALMRKVTEDIVHCMFCNLELSNDEKSLQIHMNGRKHKQAYEDILNESTNPDAYVDCYEEVINL